MMFVPVSGSDVGELALGVADATCRRRGVVGHRKGELRDLTRRNVLRDDRDALAIFGLKRKTSSNMKTSGIFPTS